MIGLEQVNKFYIPFLLNWSKYNIQFGRNYYDSLGQSFNWIENFSNLKYVYSSS